MRYISIVFIFFLFLQVIQAQSIQSRKEKSLYQLEMEAGQEALDSSNYDLAIRSFTAAVNEGRENRISEKQKVEAEKMRDLAFDLYKRNLEQETVRAQKAEEIAEEKARLAAVETIKATANLLALQSEQALENKEVDSALKFATQAIQILNTSNANATLSTQEVNVAYANAFREKYTQTYSFAPNSIFAFDFLTDEDLIIFDRKKFTTNHINFKAAKQQTIDQHEDLILAFDLNKTEKIVYAASSNNIKKTSLEQTRTIVHNNNSVITLVKAIPTKSDFLAVTKDNQILMIQDNEEKVEIEKFEDRVLSIDIQDEGNMALARLSSGVLKLIDIKQKKIVRTIKGKKGFPFESVFIPNENLLIRYYNTLSISSLDGEVLMEIEDFDGRLGDMKFSADNRYFLLHDQYGIANVYNINGSGISKINQYLKNKVLKEIHFLSNETLLTFDGENVILLDYNGNSKTVVKAKNLLKIHPSNRGQYLVTIHSDNTIKLWNIEGKEILNQNQHNSSIVETRLSPNDDYLVSYGEDGELKVCLIPNP